MGHTDKQDCTMYGDGELSLWVLNTEHLYHGFCRCEDEDDLRALVDPEFVYTDAQFAELCDDLEAELAEQRAAEPEDEDEDEDLSDLAGWCERNGYTALAKVLRELG